MRETLRTRSISRNQARAWFNNLKAVGIIFIKLVNSLFNVLLTIVTVTQCTIPLQHYKLALIQYTIPVQAVYQVAITQ